MKLPQGSPGGAGGRPRPLDTWLKLSRAAQALASKLDRGLEIDHNLSRSQFGVLEALFHLGPLPAGALAAKLLRSPTNLTTVLDNLEREGLVQRSADGADRRRRVVQLTPAGRERIERAFPAQAARITELLSVLSGAEQEHLGRLCRKLGTSAR